MSPKPSAVAFNSQNKESQMQTAMSRTEKALSHIVSAFSRPSFRRATCVVVTLVSGFVLLSGNLATRRAESRSVVTVRAAGRGKPFFNFQDGRQMPVRFGGESHAARALQSGKGTPRSLASADLDGNGTPDLIVGYVNGGTGTITIQHGNPDAFAPTDESVFARIQQGYDPQSLLPEADVYPVQAPVDFVVVGNFSHGSKDILFATEGGGLYLMAGDGKGGFGVPEQISLPGPVSALAAGEFRAADGFGDVAVAVTGPSGDTLLVFDGAEGLSNPLAQYPLAGPASGIEFGGLDEDPFQDIAVAAGNGIDVVHGWGRKESVTSTGRLERISLKSGLRGLALGEFTWDRDGRTEVAALTDDGAVQIVQQKKLDTRPFTAQEKATRTRGNMKSVLGKRDVDIESLPSWRPGKFADWTPSSRYAVSVNSASAKPILKTNLASREMDEVMVIGGGNSELEILRPIGPDDPAPDQASVIASQSGADSVAKTSLDVASEPIAAFTLPKKINGVQDVVVLGTGEVSETIVPNAPNTTITVDRTDDPSGAGLTAASACTAAGSDCSLRGAFQFANLPSNNNTTISLPANTYILSINGTNAGGCDGNTVGDLGANQTVSLTGAGAATTIIRQTGTGPANDGDRIMCMNEPFTTNLVYNFSGVTFVGGREGTAAGTGAVLGGAGIIGGELNNSLTLTNTVFANNQETVAGSANLGGGGLQITGGNLIITNSTFGGTSAPGAYTDRSSTNTGNVQTGSGGGVTYTPSSPQHTGGTGTLTVTGSTFSRNTASGLVGGGADLLIFAFASPGGIGSGTASIGTSTFSNNQALGTTSGGGIGIESLPTTVATTSFTNNSAGNRGGAIYVGGGSLLLNGTTPSITMTGNTATSGGTSVSTTSAPVNVDGTNTTLGGDIQINTGAIWTNNAGSTLSPTDVVITGGTFTMNNSTMNVAGNLSIAAAPLFAATFNGGSGTVNLQGNFSFNTAGAGATFNAGTGTFNFNGTGAQSITNSASITFNNLTDSNVTQPLTLNNSFAVNGNLNVNGANAILAPVAATVISGTGTLTGTGTARVTRIAATADFSSQYTITNKTLTNLTVEYIGTAAQVLSAITYGPLKINNGNGVNLAAGTSTVNGLLTLTTGALGVGNQILVLNDGSSVGAGSITSNPTGTVNYNQSSVGQNVRAFNYGNLTFSNFNKVLEPTGTIGISGVFTPGTAVGHTITGSTINFNGTGAQTVPAFNYNNLTISGARGANNVTLVNGGTIGVVGIFNPTATFAGGNYVITNNTIDFNGSGSQTIPAFNYFNLTSSNSGARTLQNSGTIGIANVFTPGGNAYTIAGSTINFNGSGAQSINAFNYFNLTSSNTGARTLPNGSTVGIAGAFTPGTNAYTITGNTIDYNGAGAQTISAFNYNNLTISQARGANSITLVNGGTIGIAGVFNPTATFAGGNYIITGNTIDFNGSIPQTIPAFNYNNLTSSNTGARTLANSGNIGIAGVFTPGTNAYTITGSTVVFNGSAPQTLPPTFTTYNNLTLNNVAGVTGFAGLTVQGLLRVQAGTFTSSSIYNDVQIDIGATLAGTNATTINVGGNWTNNGTFTANNNTVNFNGSGAQVIGGSSVTTFQNLTIANAGSGVSLGQNATVNGVLTLTNDLNTGANVLTMPATGTSAGTGDVIGNVKRTGFVSGGATLSFGNPNNQIKIGSGTAPADITINLVKAAPSGGIAFPTAVQRTYTITPTGGSGITATLRLHYVDSELNGNTEAGLGLWRHNGAVWSRQGATAADTSDPNNWVELNTVTQFSPWTLSSAKNDSTTTITADTPDPSLVGQAVPINFSVTSNVAGAPTPTGSVTITVNDASGDTCTGSLSGGTGTCNLTLTTVGSKTLTATYNADSNFNTSTDTEPHQVVQGTVIINDGSVPEPTSGTTNMLFTVSLSGPALGGESVDFATADQVAGPGHAVAGTCGNPGADYVATSGTVSFTVGQQVKTINVPVCSDTDNSEPDETFLVNLTNPQGGVIISDNQAIGTITVANPAGTLVISEFRTRGPLPGGANDEFVELYNNTNSPLVVPAGGYGVFKMGADCASTPVLLGTVPAATTIPARGHYLLIGSAYSLADYGGTGAAAGNLTMSSDIEDDRNIAVFSTADVLSISSTNRLDAVGFGTNTGGVCDLMREGTTLAPVGALNIEYSYFRTETSASGGNPKDTNTNASDFKFADTQGTFIAGIPQALGAPGPENLGSPLRRDNTGILLPLLDNTLSSASAPNRFRNFANVIPVTAPNGTLNVRRRVQNTTGSTVTRLRFRIVDITTFPSPGVGTADLRVITSSAVVISNINDAATCASTGTPTTVPCQVTAQAATLETPPAQPNGGGYNSTVTVSIPGGLPNNASIDVNFQLGVVQAGTFRFIIIVEALP